MKLTFNTVDIRGNIMELKKELAEVGRKMENYLKELGF